MFRETDSLSRTHQFGEPAFCLAACRYRERGSPPGQAADQEGRLRRFDPSAPAPSPNESPPAGGSVSFDDCFGNWSSSSDASAPLASNQPVAPSPQAGRLRKLDCNCSRNYSTQSKSTCTINRAWKAAWDRHRPTDAVVDHATADLRFFGSLCGVAQQFGPVPFAGRRSPEQQQAAGLRIRYACTCGSFRCAI